MQSIFIPFLRIDFLSMFRKSSIWHQCLVAVNELSALSTNTLLDRTHQSALHTNLENLDVLAYVFPLLLIRVSNALNRSSCSSFYFIHQADLEFFWYYSCEYFTWPSVCVTKFLARVSTSARNDDNLAEDSDKKRSGARREWSMRWQLTYILGRTQLNKAQVVTNI